MEHLKVHRPENPGEVLTQMAYDRLLEQVTYGWMDMPSAENF